MTIPTNIPPSTWEGPWTLQFRPQKWGLEPFDQRDLVAS